ncbi:MAG: YkgJ family cysteine cluster protein [Desulfobacterales bacterium]|nr:MAG: YkgJ family cysteine cluster protein [Desulfobacterales bacterium]
MPNNRSAAEISECIRCGTCCKKGGPSLHHEDTVLIEKGLILSKYLFTIREGEMSYDNVTGQLIPASSDIIKIKGRKGSLTCVFFNEPESACTIYDKRPLECRILECWDTREIERVYAKTRLTRKHLVSTIAGLWDLIDDHQARCSYEKINRLLKMLGGDNKDDALKEILEMIQYDTQIREMTVQKGGLDPDIVDFLFGRPIKETIGMYGFKLKKQGDAYRLITIPTGQNL